MLSFITMTEPSCQLFAATASRVMLSQVVGMFSSDLTFALLFLAFATRFRLRRSSAAERSVPFRTLSVAARIPPFPSSFHGPNFGIRHRARSRPSPLATMQRKCVSVLCREILEIQPNRIGEIPVDCARIHHRHKHKCWEITCSDTIRRTPIRRTL